MVKAAGRGGNNVGEQGFWTTGKVVFAVIAGVVLLGSISFGIAGGLGAFNTDDDDTTKKAPDAKPVSLTGQAAGAVTIDILNGKDSAGNSWVTAGDGTLSGVAKFSFGGHGRSGRVCG